MAAAIDLTRMPAPDAIEALDYETLQEQFLERFKTVWTAARAVDPTLPAYDVDVLETDPVVIASQAWSYLRLLDRARVNDAVRAVLAPTAKKADLDNVCARIGVQRLVVVPATDTAEAVMESDARLLARYLLAFSRPAAGSAERYLYEAMTAWPQLHHAAVIGRAVHGRRGDVDLVIAGPSGRDATDDELALVRSATNNTRVKPEATSLSVLRATRGVYDVTGTIIVPTGPDAEAVRAEAEARILAAGQARMLIGAQVPRSALEGAAYGLSVTRADLTSPGDIPADPYTIPIPGVIELSVEVAG
ncbi:baseplate assembly protein [Rhodomicrobium udaipurense JA643]|uniref:Baseplate J/gp47 family protein n=1 Tax=Rhodomicrobium udaipurense TaxID=1202716 RepID=A0A8I1KJT9_9HYPH|nr:baseplate J/gp47 family protein [Rhodomicrobium udaipurense]KAI94092.1 baseplate assembly protein [Rhodomicrobium udaipurense JA643]MBJ7543264.1 baseplate J/gp47 family protein [Rhodomicrobium udaipurense]